MIRFSDVTFTYADADLPVLSGVDLEIPAGEMWLVAGGTGSGKTSFLSAINGLVPHFTGGTLEGSVEVDGRSTALHPPSAFADLIGYVGQSPERGFVAERVEGELAYGLEQHGVAPTTMRTRVEETLDLLGIASLRDRRLTSLSGGEQQRVAIGSVLAMHPSVLVLDEPTSALDPAAAEEVLAILTRLVHDLGMTVVLAEHRLERVVQYADRMVLLGPDGRVESGSASAVLATAPLVPPVIELSRLLGWDPPALTVREARRRAADVELHPAPPGPSRSPEHAVAAATRLTVSYGPTVAVRHVDLEFARGEVSVVMGRNGSGKSSLFWVLSGTMEPATGSVEVAGTVRLVPQNPGDLLYLPTVAAECRQADLDARRAPGSCRSILDVLVPGVADESHPNDLSEGQRLALVLAIQLLAEPDLLLLDEPTRGLDYRAKAALAGVVRRLADEGRSVVLSTHDVEFAAIAGDRVVVMAQGEVVADDTARAVLTATPLFAPQITRVFAPTQVLAVAEVASAATRAAP